MTAAPLAMALRGGMGHTDAISMSKSLVHGAQVSVLSDICLISALNGTCRQGFCDDFPIDCAESGPINLVSHLSTRNEWFRYLLLILV